MSKGLKLSHVLVGLLAVIAWYFVISPFIDDMSNGDSASQSVSKGENDEVSEEIKAKIESIEYSFVLSSLRSQGAEDIGYKVTDGDGDCYDELFLEAITDGDYPMHTQFIADADGSNSQFWGYAPTGAAESSNFCTMDGYDTVLWNDDFSTIGYSESHYKCWIGTGWEEITELDGVAFDYDNKVDFDNPDLLNIEIQGEPMSIFAATKSYFKGREGAIDVGSADLDNDGMIECVYCVKGAGNRWFDKLEMENTTENQCTDGYHDDNLTVVIVDETIDGVVLRPVLISYSGLNIKIIENTLSINDVCFNYFDTDNTNDRPSLTSTSSIFGSNSKFNSLGERTILGMIGASYSDVRNLCTNINFSYSDPESATAEINGSQCRFYFNNYSNRNAITSDSIVRDIEVNSWGFVNGEMAIDPTPVIGDFSMGDAISELRKLMVSSGEWSPLLYGQDIIASTSFYYRPSDENGHVYQVIVMADGETLDSRVCGIRLEQMDVADLEAKSKKALGY